MTAAQIAAQLFGTAASATSGGSIIVDAATAIAIIAAGLGALFAGLAAMRVADAWKIWAARCDPMNPNFRPPSIGRKQ